MSKRMFIARWWEQGCRRSSWWSLYFLFHDATKPCSRVDYTSMQERPCSSSNNRGRKLWVLSTVFATVKIYQSASSSFLTLPQSFQVRTRCFYCQSKYLVLTVGYGYFLLLHDWCTRSIAERVSTSTALFWQNHVDNTLLRDLGASRI